MRYPHSQRVSYKDDLQTNLNPFSLKVYWLSDRSDRRLLLRMHSVCKPISSLPPSELVDEKCSTSIINSIIAASEYA